MVRILLQAAVLGLAAQDQPAGGLLRHLSIANLKSSGVTAITAIKSDAEGNIYVAGTTASFDFPVKNAAQPAMGERILLRSTDRGLTWAGLQNAADVEEVLAFAAHPQNPSILIRGIPQGIEKTIDGGRTWRRTYSTNSRTRVSYPIVIDPADPRRIYAKGFGTFGLFLVSDDAGESWRQRQIPENNSAPSFFVDPTGTGAILAGPLLSRDQGASWSTIRLPESRFMKTVLDSSRRGWIFAHTSVGASGALYLSTDWGATWTERSLPARDGGFRPSVDSLAFDPDSPGTIHVTAMGTRYLSADDGMTWRTVGRGDSSPDVVSLSRRCGGGGLFSQSTTILDFGDTARAQSLPRIQFIVAGPDCSLYAVRTATSDAFVAKWSSDGRELQWASYLGGVDRDQATALALDAHGNVYVAGTTTITDLPIGPPRGNADLPRPMFVSKFDADGRLIYSSTVDTRSLDVPTALAVNESGEAYVAGWTLSRTFPTTAGAVSVDYPGPGAAFAVKFGSAGAIVYSTYIGEIGRETNLNSGGSIATVERHVAAAVTPDGSLFLGGFGGRLVRVSNDGATIERLPAQPGRILAMDRGAGGEIYVAGARQAGTRSVNCVVGTGFAGVQIFRLASDVFVRKMSPADGAMEWQAELNGSCASWPESMAISPAGEVALGISSSSPDFPRVNPLLLNGYCGSRLLAKLSAADGKLVESTTLDECAFGGPLVAPSPDGGVYVASNYGGNGILRIPKAEPRDIHVDSVVDALSGAPGRVTPGRLLLVSAAGATGEIADAGLNHPGALPLELAGVRVMIDEQSVGILRVSARGIICAVPRDLIGKESVRVRIFGPEGRISSPLLLPVDDQFPALSLLTKAFPELPARDGNVDLNVRNADGTLNSASNPAVIGSTVTLFATGVPANRAVPLVWNPPPPQRFQLIQSVYGRAEPMPGFVEELWAVRFRIPDAAGPGVLAAPTPGVLSRAVINGYGIYIK